MSSVSTESDPLPTWGLDFANSHSGPPPAQADPLMSIDELSEWWQSDDRRITAPLPTSLPDRRTLLTEAPVLRAAIRSTLAAVSSASPIPAEALFVLNRAIGFAHRSERLVVHHGSAVPTLERPVDLAHPLAPLSVIALDAADFVTRVDPARLRECAAGGCGTWFVDTSKGGRRRWCSMTLCGNRSKAERYRTRHAGHD